MKEYIKNYLSQNINDKILFEKDDNFKYLILSSDSTLDLQFITNGENIKGDIFAIFFGDKPLSANIISKINHSNSYINVFLLSFITDKNIVDVQGDIKLAKNISSSQGHLLEKNIVLNPKNQKINIKAVPRLDVYSNDVQATHGVSIDRIGDENLFYLNSKGLDENASQELVIKGYIQNILDQFTQISDNEKTKIQKTILDKILYKND